MIKTVLDTNVAVSGLLSRGASSRIFDFVQEGKIILRSSPLLIAALTRVLAYPRLSSYLDRRGVSHLRVHGKGSKLRYIPTRPGTSELITDDLEAIGHALEPSAPLFQPVKDNISGKTNKAMTTDGVYQVVMAYAERVGLGELKGFGVHFAAA